MSAFFPFQWLFSHNIDKLKKLILINLIYMKKFIQALLVLFFSPDLALAFHWDIKQQNGPHTPPTQVVNLIP